MDTVALKTAHEWAKEMGIVILDSDGWRGKDVKSLDEPISHAEFERRICESTIQLSRR